MRNKTVSVRELHREFLRCGADVMQALTFYASDDKLENRGNSARIMYTVRRNSYFFSYLPVFDFWVMHRAKRRYRRRVCLFQWLLCFTFYYLRAYGTDILIYVSVCNITSERVDGSRSAGPSTRNALYMYHCATTNSLPCHFVAMHLKTERYIRAYYSH